jgi:hypothetical protein
MREYTANPFFFQRIAMAGWIKNSLFESSKYAGRALGQPF